MQLITFGDSENKLRIIESLLFHNQLKWYHNDLRIRKQFLSRLILAPQIKEHHASG